MRVQSFFASIVLVSALVAAPAAEARQAAPEWRPDPARYAATVTRDVPIRLKDGTVLRADIHAPSDPATGAPAAGPFPVVLGLTPYGKTPSAQLSSTAGQGGFTGLNPYLVRRGYIGVLVDVPGTGGSEGRSELFGRAEARAGRQIVDWAARLPRSNGKVGMLGGSYLAIDQMFTAAEVGPGSPLKAIFPMAVAADPYRDLFVSGGVVNLESPAGLLFGYAGTRTVTPFLERPTDPRDALRLALEHLKQAGPFELTTARDIFTDGPRRYDGPYWRERAPERVLRKIVDNGVAVYASGGLYDVFQRGEPLIYSGLQNAAAGRPVHAPMRPGQAASGKYQMLYGPWHHGSIGQGTDLDGIELRWFDHWLKGRDTGITATTTPLHVIEPGGARYDTATFATDRAKVRRLDLGPGGRLAGRPPGASGGSAKVNFTGLSDPCNRAVDQFAAGLLTQLFQSFGRPNPCTAPRRQSPPGPGEIHYTSEPFASPLSLAGPVGVTLRAAATTRETMWVVTLEDVAPDGTATQLSSGAQLGSLRAVDRSRSWPGAEGGWLLPYHPFTKASQRPVKPGEVTRYDIEVRPVFATLPAGHRLRVKIGTGEIPHLFPPLTALGALAGGTYTVQHHRAARSWIDLPVR